MGRGRIRPALGLLAALWAGGLAVACKLDLDESLIEQKDSGSGASSAGGSGAQAGGAGAPAGAAGVGAAGAGGTAGASAGGAGGSGATSGSGGTGGTPEAGASCDATAQCGVDGGSGCNEGVCANGSCSYEICPSSNACEARSCDQGSGSCAAPATLGFHAGSIDVGDVLMGGASQALAAAGDFVFVGTAGGVLAWRVTNPLQAESVPVTQPPFAITRIAASGSRVLLLGPVAAGKLSLAWIDVPDGATAQLVPDVVAVNFAESVSAVYPSSSGAFFLVKADAGQLWPATYLGLPITSNATVTMSPSTGIPAGAAIVASSDTRLVAFRVEGTAGAFNPTFSLETSAGTPSAQSGGEQSLLATTGEVASSLAAHYFSSHPSGSVGWTTNQVTREDGGATSTSSAAFFWPLVDSDTTFDGSRKVTLETYPAPVGEGTQNGGPSALLDDATAIVTAAASENTANTAVHVVTRSGATLTLGAGRHVLPFTPQQTGVAATRRFGIVLTPSTTTPPAVPDTTLHLFAPSCT